MATMSGFAKFDRLKSAIHWISLMIFFCNSAALISGLLDRKCLLRHGIIIPKLSPSNGTSCPPEKKKVNGGGYFSVSANSNLFSFEHEKYLLPKVFF